MLPDTGTHMMQMLFQAGNKERWHCFICGREVDIEWTPDFKKETIEPGDLYATHTGIKSIPGLDMQMGASAG